MTSCQKKIGMTSNLDLGGVALCQIRGNLEFDGIKLCQGRGRASLG